MISKAASIVGRGSASTDRNGVRLFCGRTQSRICLMPLQLRADVHWCECDGRAVFIDTLADRYFCLPELANDAFLRLAAAQPLPGDAARLRSLVESEILLETEAPAPIPPPPPIDTPTHDIIDRHNPKSWLAILSMFVAEIRAARVLRKRPFHEILESARRQPLGRRPPKPARTIEAIASAAAALSFITGSHDRCLVRALAVQALCKASGSKSNLVFGVVAHPFTAHCWVQVGSAVIVGEYEHARLYTPILVI